MKKGKRTILKEDFFNRSALWVAKDLLGKYLVRRFPSGKIAAYMIVETEAYDGEKDLAAHSSKGLTARTEVLFGKAGVWYVYFIYGMYEMLNIVTKKDGAAVLIREVEGYNGPGKLTRALKITRTLNKMKAIPKSGLWVEDRGVKIPKSKIKRTPRIGVDYAGKWKEKLYRFILEK